MGFIERLETSENDRAKCSLCSKKIIKGELRGVAVNQKYISVYYYCYYCSLQVLKEYQELIKSIFAVSESWKQTEEYKKWLEDRKLKDTEEKI